MQRKASTKALRERTHSREQRAIQKEFCDAYGFAPEQVSFEGKSLDPIFDFDALSMLSAKLCNLPHVEAAFGAVHPMGLATCTGYAVLPNGNTRKIFASAVVGEKMPDGEEIRDIHQAITISRARAFRMILRHVGFDPVAAHRSFKKTGNVIELQLPAKLPRDKERAEIHLLAQGLGLIAMRNGKEDRARYEKLISGFYPPYTSSLQLSDQQHSEFLAILRANAKARAVANDSKAAKAS